MTDFTMQANFKIGNTLVNIRADTGPEMLELVQWFESELADVVTRVTLALDAQHAAGATLGAQPVQGWQQQPAAAPQGPQGPPQGGIAPCEHGNRVYKTGTNKATGAGWQGWFCPSNVTGCKPQWVK